MNWLSQVHVVCAAPEKWVIKALYADKYDAKDLERVIDILPTKEEAVAYARGFCRASTFGTTKDHSMELYVHTKDGKIETKDSYGHDPRDIPG